VIDASSVMAFGVAGGEVVASAVSVVRLCQIARMIERAIAPGLCCELAPIERSGGGNVRCEAAAMATALNAIRNCGEALRV